ncbi:N-acetylmuramoyl-L-alanine amidase [Aeromonas dhakensis]|uniref:N-acetylmuramoyl-L-alanine amidase n=1 Tax=Aeromonas dhakensis TaxID=196024 RepID=UPI00244C6546|nr:N-acetylmuramoyl-L-alanine amidase [Aeromonas dhakensis]MDH0348155.1 N-acetylmuramoyl-L-alanine amidase [Aeromonas dhakensis]
MTIKFITVHCSATQGSRDIGAKEITAMHKNRGFRTIGYHHVIRRDGTVEPGRPETETGAHVAGFNKDNLGICLVGGVNAAGKPENNYTPAQLAALAKLITSLQAKYAVPDAAVKGHRDWFGDTNKDGKIDSRDWLKDCPCFDVGRWWASTKPKAA